MSVHQVQQFFFNHKKSIIEFAYLRAGWNRYHTIL